MVGAGSWELDLDGDELTFSPGLARLLGLGDGERLTTRSHLARVHPADRQLVERAGAECISAGSALCEYRVTLQDGRVRVLSLSAEMVPDTAETPGRRMRGALLDVTAQRTAERERVAAEHLFRQGFDAAPIGMALSDPGSGCCRRVNDAMCRLLRRPRAELIGESMHAFSHPDDKASVRDAREAMIRGETSSFRAEHRVIRPDGTVAWGMLHLSAVRTADGSVEAFYTQLVDISERKDREARLEDDLSDAIWLGRIRDALDEQRLMLYAQPIVDLTTGETVQHELLLRMRGEDGSVILPGEFLPAAERYGLVSEIDRWVIRQAAQIAAGGTATEFNLSGRSIGDATVLRELASAIEETGVDPSLLAVEVTETAFAGQTKAGRAFAERVRELGCRLALDDFGTGFSSLSYLKHLPADHLKIDIEFVRELTSSETDARVVRGIVGLAREFRQTTIAEGVEDEATLLLLRELGVDMAQGYLFGAPAPRPDTPTVARPHRRASSAHVTDPVGLVRSAFDSFATRDVAAMLAYCRPDIVLRPFVTRNLAERREPYRGHDGVRDYLADVAKVWDELTLTPLTFRETQDSVIGFGRAAGRLGDEHVVVSIMWIVRLADDQIASLEVFQAAG
jgi:PAS domain S-box-containing protein